MAPWNTHAGLSRTRPATMGDPRPPAPASAPRVAVPNIDDDACSDPRADQRQSQRELDAEKHLNRTHPHPPGGFENRLVQILQAGERVILHRKYAVENQGQKNRFETESKEGNCKSQHGCGGYGLGQGGCIAYQGKEGPAGGPGSRDSQGDADQSRDEGGGQ